MFASIVFFFSFVSLHTVNSLPMESMTKCNLSVLYHINHKDSDNKVNFEWLSSRFAPASACRAIHFWFSTKHIPTISMFAPLGLLSTILWLEFMSCQWPVKEVPIPRGKNRKDKIQRTHSKINICLDMPLQFVPLSSNRRKPATTYCVLSQSRWFRIKCFDVNGNCFHAK